MNDQKQAQFTVYAAEAAIPRYQRAGVWGLAALAILLCGIVAGWLFGRAGSLPWESARPAATVLVRRSHHVELFHPRRLAARDAGF
jgi:hypothetical protein